MSPLRWLARMCLCSVLFATASPSISWSQGEGVGTVNPGAVHGIAHDVATDLMANLGPAAVASGGRLRVAVRPFNVDEVTNLRTAEQLNSEVEGELKAAAGDRLVIVERSAMAKVWAEVKEFQGNDPSDHFRDLIRGAGADVLVFGTMSSGRDGYSVAYRAVDVRAATTGAIMANTREPRLLSATFVDRGAARFDDAEHTAAVQLAAQLVSVSKITSDQVTFSRSGEQSAVVDTLLNNLEDELRAQIKRAVEKNASSAQAYTGESAAPAGPAEIVLSAKPVEFPAWIEVHFRAQTKDRGAATGTTVHIFKGDPHFGGLLPLNKNGPFTATAEAAIKGAMDRDSAIRAAKALARARVIGQKTNPSIDDTPVMVNSLSDGANAMQAIAGGVTSDEQWNVEDVDGGTRVRVRLTAKVKALGGGDAPRIKAVISSPVIQSGTPFSLTLSSDKPCYVGVFGWTSDDLVLRAFPYGKHGLIRLEPGKPVTLPRATAKELDLTSVLRDHVAADFEGLIVVSSSDEIPYDDVAQPPASTYKESMERAVPIQGVFESLSKLPGNISVNIVPYQLVAKQ